MKLLYLIQLLEKLLVQRCCSSSVLPAGALFPSLPLSDFQLALALLWDVLTGLIRMCACLISSLSPSDLVARPHWSAGEATRDNGGASPGVRNELNSGDGGVARPLAAPPPPRGRRGLVGWWTSAWELTGSLVLLVSEGAE